MSSTDTKYVLREHSVFPNRFLGQNFTIAPWVAQKLVEYANIQPTDVVLDAGAGTGFLAHFVSKKCKEVLAVEKDPRLVSILREHVPSPNIRVIAGDLFRTQIPHFDKVVSAPSYGISTNFLIWLFNRDFNVAALVLQKEFAGRLVAPVGAEEYGWLTVIAYYNVNVEILDAVPKHVFYPAPKVDSVIVRLEKVARDPRVAKNHDAFIKLVRSLFVHRNRKVANAIKPFIRSEALRDNKEKTLAVPFAEKRVRALLPENFAVIANELYS